MLKTNPHIYSHTLIQQSELETFKQTDSFIVMKKAAKASYEYIYNNYNFQKILILCGPGNNGGDGLLIAKHFLDKNRDVSIFAPLELGKTQDSKKALTELNNHTLIKENINFSEYDVIIDSLFGIGFNKILSDELIEIFNQINHASTYTVSIDMPSGVFTDSGQISPIAIKANTTLTFHRLKPGLLLLPGKEYAGDIELLDIDLADLDSKTKIQLLKPPLLKKISTNIHKYNRGTTYIIAGNELIGAAKLAALAASQSSLRVGGGVSKIFVAEADINFFKPQILEEMIIPFSDTNHLINIIQQTNISSLIYGCGMDINKQNIELLQFLLKQSFGIVLDASAFSMMKNEKEMFFELLSNRKAITILTPHKGEFETIFSNTKNKIESIQDASKLTNSIVLYKGNDTVVASPNGDIFINYFSSPYLATAGSGDVLAGMIGGFLSQQYSGIDATLLGCYVHSQCGINLNKGLIASDLIDEIPTVLKQID